MEINPSKELKYGIRNNTKLIKILQKEIDSLKNLPFKYKIKYLDDAEVEEVNYITNIIFVSLVFTEFECPRLSKNYNIDIYFNFPNEYPIMPPTIMIPDLEHQMIYDEKLNLCDYCPILKLNQLIANCYCIILESLINPKRSILNK